MTSTTTTLADYATLDARVGTAAFDLAEDGSSYTVTRLFGAPPTRVHRAFTHADDISTWFAAGAPGGSELSTCESDPREGGAYHYVMSIPEIGEISWHGTYTAMRAPEHIAADEWFIMGEGSPEGAPTTQTLDFVAVDGGGTMMTMIVNLTEPEDPQVFMEQSAAGLGSSLSALDALVSA